MDDSTSSSGRKRLHALITGQVQGVGFRWFVIRHARPLNVSGWVRNLNNGSVEVVAEGSGDKLNSLVEILRRGPSYSYIRDVDIQWLESKGIEGGFDVKY